MQAELIEFASTGNMQKNHKHMLQRCMRVYVYEKNDVSFGSRIQKKERTTLIYYKSILANYSAELQMQVGLNGCVVWIQNGVWMGESILEGDICFKFQAKRF